MADRVFASPGAITSYRHACSLGDPGALTIYEMAHERRQFIATHEHELARIAILLDGPLIERGDSWREEFPAGTVIFWSPGATHEDRFGSMPSHSIHAELSPAMFERLRKVFPPAPTTALGPELFEGAVRTLLRELERRDAAAPLALEAAIYTLIARASRILSCSMSPSF